MRVDSHGRDRAAADADREVRATVSRRPASCCRLAAASRCRAGSEAGFTIVELIVAVTLFALMFTALSLGMGGVLRADRNNRSRSTAAYLAAKQVDKARGLDFDQVGLGRTTQSYDDPSSTSTYTITQDVAWVTPTSNSSSCNVPNGSSGGAVAYKRVTVRVTWPNMAGTAPVSSQTLLTPPTGAYDPYDGHIAVQLYDRDAEPLADKAVTLSGAGTASQVTTEEGCAFFAYLNPGTYTVTLSTTGYVDRQLNQPSTQTVSVIAAQITKVQFDYDRAATLTVTVTSPSGAVVPDNLPLTVANSNLTLGTKAVPGTGLTRTVTPLFPYAGGYQVWMGDCTDNDPGTYAGGSRGPVLPTSPGGSASGTTALDAVDVLVLRGTTATPNASATIVADHVNAVGCGAETFTTTAAVTDAAGKLRLALPYGTWRIRASNRTLLTGYQWPTVTLDPVSGTIPQVTARVS
jgi:type II secretory pathway pseudopilin PulG